MALAPISTLNIGGAEIAAYAADHQVAVVTGGDKSLRVVDLSNPALARQLDSITLPNNAQSVAVYGDLVAIALSAPLKTDDGTIHFYRLSGVGAAAKLTDLGAVSVGALPDSIAFNATGTKLVVANEGEPGLTYDGENQGANPEGSISVVAINDGNPANMAVTTLKFDGALLKGLGFGDTDEKQTAALKAAGIRISAGTALTDLEPEYVTITGNQAFVTLQENNAVAVVDLTTNAITAIRGLGEKDWNGIEIDTTDKDGGYLPTVKSDKAGVLVGLRMADAIDSFVIGGKTYTITANEGDGRVRPDGYNFEAPDDGTYYFTTTKPADIDIVEAIVDPEDVDKFIYATKKSGLAGQIGTAGVVLEKKDELFVWSGGIEKDDDAFYNDEVRAGKLEKPSGNTVLDEGRLKTVKDQNADDKIVAFGARSFSIFDDQGRVVFDSGNELAEIAHKLGVYSDGRSDDKGTEPEGVTVAEINGRTYAFIGIERATSSTILQYDISNPEKSFFVQALRNPNAISAEGLETFKVGNTTYLMAANEVTGHLDVYEVENKTIGSTTALIPEAGSAVKADWLKDGQSGNTNFPYGKFKALATIGEIDSTTGKALTGYPDGNAAWLLDDNTIRVAYQSESYATMSNETYASEMDSGVTFTGSKVHYIDYDRAKFADFLNNNSPASDMVKGSGELFDTVYNIFGEEVDAKNTDKTDLSAKWGNQVKPDGTLVEFAKDQQLNEADFFFQSFCGAWFEQANKYGDGIGFEDDVWLMAEEWNIGSSMFEDPDGDGPLTGKDVAHETMGLASMVVDIANKTAYTAPALGQSGYEKIMPINSQHEDYVVLVMAGYNHDQEPAPNRIYVGIKDKKADGNAIDYNTATDRDAFLARNGLLYGKIYGLALDDATYASLGISADPTKKMVDDYMKDADAPSSFSGKFVSTSYQWEGFDKPKAVEDTEMFLWEKPSEQPAGHTFFNGDTKTEHPAVDPDMTKSRYVQNMTDEGGILGFDLGKLGEQLTAANGKLPTALDVDVTRIVAAVDGSLTLKTGGEGLAHTGANNPDGTATAATHLEARAGKMVAPDGLLWVKNADGDFLIVDEDSGNEYGERKYAIPLNSADMTLRDANTGYLLAIGGGKFNPRAEAEASALGDAYSGKENAEFSGSWNVTALVARDQDGQFYSKKDLAGTGEQEIISGLSQKDQKYIGVIQHRGESGGQVAGTQSDAGGQLFMFDMALPILDKVDQHQSADKSFLLDFASTDLETIYATTTASRSANHDSTIGFYKVLDTAGTVFDHLTGQTVKVGEAGYQDAALHGSNRLGGALARNDGQTSEENLVFTGFEGGYVAMFGINHTQGQTYFSFAGANEDGYNHFKYLGSNKVGFEDLYGGGDKDHNDLIATFGDFA